MAWNHLNEQNAHNKFFPNFLTFPTFPTKMNAKMGFFAKSKFVELILYKKKLRSGLWLAPNGQKIKKLEPKTSYTLFIN